MRKTLDLTITAEGRDKGKTYRITEMPAMQAERWASRCLVALAKSGAELPDDFKSAGMAGIAKFGLKALGGLEFDDARPLLDEMLTCAKNLPNPANPMVEVAVGDGNVEEVATILHLRLETLKLHMDFLRAGSALT